jgi:hypothetical protein
MSCSKSPWWLAASVLVVLPLHSSGAEPVRLTTDGLLKRDPVFWPTGKELIYSVLTPSKDRRELMRLMRIRRKPIYRKMGTLQVWKMHIVYGSV